METVEKIYTEVINVLENILDADAFSVFVRSKKKKKNFRYSQNLSESFTDWLEKQTSWPAPENQPFLLSDTEKEKCLPLDKEKLLQENIHAIAVIPILGQKEIIGRLLVYYKQPHLLRLKKTDSSKA